MMSNADNAKPSRAEVVRRRRQQTLRQRIQAVAHQTAGARSGPLVSRPRRVAGQGPWRPAGRWQRFGVAVPGGGVLALPRLDLPDWTHTWRMASLTMVLLLGAMLLRLLTDRQMYVTSINLGGAVLVPPEEIYAESGLAGQHIFWVDPAATAERVAAIPGLAAAQVEVAWPAQVTVVVEERVPQVLLREGGKEWWVDAQGREFKARGDLPGLLPIESQAGQPLDGLPPEAVLGALQLKQLRGNIEKLYYEPARGLSYQDGRGWRGYFGVGLDMAEKLAVYERLVEDLMGQGLTPREISVENVRAPFYKR
jgi:hypothetical protein